MSTRATPPNATDDPDMDRLLRTAGPRSAVSPLRSDRVRAKVREAWRLNNRRRLTKRRSLLAAGVFAAAISLLLVSPKFLSRSDRVVLGESVATVEHVDGTLPPVRVQQVLRVGEQIGTGRDSRLALRFRDGTSVRVDTKSRLRALGPSVVELTAGAVYVDTGTETGRFEVRTPVASVHDVGTQFEVRLLDAQLRVRVRAGLVELRDGIRSISARRGTEIILSSSGAVRRPVAVHGEEWQWTARLALPLEMDGTSLAQFLERIAREHGWTVEYRGGPPMALEAQQIVLYGSVAGLTAEGAVAVAVSASGLRHVLDRGTLVILRDEERRSGETKDVR